MTDTEQSHHSVTSLALYERCPFEYWVWRIRGETPPFAPALDHGTSVHEQIAAHLQGKPVAAPRWDFQRFRRSRFNRTPMLIEHPFTAQLEDLTVVGRIDAVYAAEPRFEVVDFKTGRGSDSCLDDLQLPLYCLGLATAWGQPVESFSYTYYYLSSSSEYRRRMTADVAEAITERTRLIAAGLRAGAYNRRCGRCWACRGNYGDPQS
jgi:hypothetical protein